MDITCRRGAPRRFPHRLAYGLKVKLDKEKDAHRAEETAFQALEAKTKASEQRASDEGTATQGLRVKLEGMEADRAWPRRWRGGSNYAINPIRSYTRRLQYLEL